MTLRAMCINSLMKEKVWDGLSVVCWCDVPKSVRMASMDYLMTEETKWRREGRSKTTAYISSWTIYRKKEEDKDAIGYYLFISSSSLPNAFPTISSNKILVALMDGHDGREE